MMKDKHEGTVRPDGEAGLAWDTEQSRRAAGWERDRRWKQYGEAIGTGIGKVIGGILIMAVIVLACAAVIVVGTSVLRAFGVRP